MRDRAPMITRQRLLVEGFYTIEVDEDVVRRFLYELPAALGLRTEASACSVRTGWARVRGQRGVRRAHLAD